MTQVKLQQGQPQAPYVSGIPVVVPAVRVRVEPLGAHVGARAHVRVTRVQRSAHDLAYSEVSYLHFHLVVDQQIRGFKVTVNDLVTVEVVETVKNLPRHVCELGLGEGPVGLEQRLQGAKVHVLHQNRDVAGRFLEDAMAADHVGGVGPAEDIHLPEDLAADGRIGVGVSLDDLERIESVGALMADLVDRAAIAVPENLKLFEVTGGYGSGGGGGGGGSRSIGR